MQIDINATNEGFYNYDLEEFTFILSPGWKEFLGFDKEENVKYLDYMNLVAEVDRFDLHHAIHDAIEEYSGEVEYIHYKTTYELTTKRGVTLRVEDYGDIFFNDACKPIRIEGFHRNVTNNE